MERGATLPYFPSMTLVLRRKYEYTEDEILIKVSIMSQDPIVINNPLIVDQVYKDIKRRIIKGELLPDSKLSIRVLCEYYKISDTPLKQALNRLISEHLVLSIPRRGMQVSSFSQKDIHEAIEARTMIELFAVPAAIASVKKSNHLIELLEENIAEDEKLINEVNDLSSYTEFAQRELEVSQGFHLLIVKNLNNKTITNIYLNILNHRYLYYQIGKDKTAQAIASLSEHKMILDRLKSGDEDGVMNAIRLHLKAREDDVNSARGDHS